MASITTMLGELGLPWVMTSYKEKKMSGGLYNSTIKKLCPQSRCGREDKCGLSCMSPVRTHEKQPQRAKSRSWLDLTGTGSFKRFISNSLWRTLTYGQPGGRKLELLTPSQLPPKEDRKPFLQLLLGQQSALRGFQGPSQETSCVLTGLCLSKH